MIYEFPIYEFNVDLVDVNLQFLDEDEDCEFVDGIDDENTTEIFRRLISAFPSRVKCVAHTANIRRVSKAKKARESTNIHIKGDVNTPTKTLPLAWLDESLDEEVAEGTGAFPGFSDCAPTSAGNC
uniref:Uncharacterized protein n=1 Tax=Ditylenchus dipsaci TaxID=166011 RepID=A0A915CR23_9BILA